MDIILFDLCHHYRVPCRPDQVLSISVQWSPPFKAYTPEAFTVRPMQTVTVVYQDRGQERATVLRDGEWNEETPGPPAHRPAESIKVGITVTDGGPGVSVGAERIRLKGSLVRPPNEIDGLRALPGGGWELPPEVAAFMVKPQDTTEYWREKAREYLAVGAPNHAPPNACPHCGHAAPPGPRCAVCRRYLD